MNSTNLFERAPSGTLTLDDVQVLPSINDLERSLSAFEELVSKYETPKLLDCCIIWHTYGACEAFRIFYHHATLLQLLSS